MLDKVINKHLDAVDTVQEKMDKEIDEFIDDLDIEVILTNPQEYMVQIAKSIQDEIINKYIEKAKSLGEAFGKAAEVDGEIVIEDSNDPRRNAE